jgi:hypothetical protein
LARGPRWWGRILGRRRVQKLDYCAGFLDAKVSI